MALNYHDTKLLVENWQRFGRDEGLLTEIAQGPENMDPKMRVSIHQSPRGFEVSLWGTDERWPDSPVTLVGEIRAKKAQDHDAPAMGAFEIKWSQTSRSKWGPMLYDIAMECATEDGSGIMADRDMVSAEARRVWDYYYENRPDVEAIQLDDRKNTLTRTKRDNAKQGSSRSKINLDARGIQQRTTTNWTDSPLSKMYRVRNGTTPTIDKLRKMGKLKDWRGWKSGNALP